MHVNVLDSDPLLALAAVPIERIEQHRVGPRKLIGLGEVLASAFEALFADHGAPVAFHAGVVGGDQLRRYHAFDLVPRPNAGQRRNGGGHLPVAFLVVRVLGPE
jgi:hypothetical protein